MAKISIVPWIVKKLKRCIGIVEDTDTASQAIASDKYVIWKGDVCKSTSAISEGDTLSSSNLSAVNDGIGNDLSQSIATLNNQMGNMGSIVEIANITASGDSTITHDLDQYRYVYFAYYSATFYRQTAIYHKAIATGSVKAGLDNLMDGSNRCYCLKTAYNSSTHVMNLSTLLPSTGTWQGGSFYIYGIK